jgi:hypothetical protein
MNRCTSCALKHCISDAHPLPIVAASPPSAPSTRRRPFRNAQPLFSVECGTLDVECLVFEYTSAKRHRLTPKPSFYSHQHAVSCQLGTYRIGESCKGESQGVQAPYSTRPVSASARPATRQ